MVILSLLFLIFSREVFSEGSTTSNVVDLGVHGTLFEIEEEDLLRLIQKRLLYLKESGVLQKHQELLLKKTQEKILTPKPVRGIQKATQNRVFYYDPTIILPYDLKDHQGRVFQKKGTHVNPLVTISLSKDLVFIDGSLLQLAWVQKTYIKPKKPVKVILIKGEPFKCEEMLKVPCYFDQEGGLSQKLGITKVPSSVSQEGLRLRIEEHNIGEGA